MRLGAIGFVLETWGIQLGKHISGGNGMFHGDMIHHWTHHWEQILRAVNNTKTDAAHHLTVVFSGFILSFGAAPLKHGLDHAPSPSVVKLSYLWYPKTLMFHYRMYLSTYLSIYLSIDLSIYRSIDLLIYRSIDLSIYRSIDLSIHPSIHPSISKYIDIYIYTICF